LALPAGEGTPTVMPPAFTFEGLSNVPDNNPAPRPTGAADTSAGRWLASAFAARDDSQTGLQRLAVSQTDDPQFGTFPGP